MKIKQGDKFLVEVKVTDTPTVDGSVVVHSDGYNKNYFIHKKILEKAEKIEPEYEDGAYYWVANEKGQDADPMKYSRNGGFHLFSSMYFDPYYIGDKIPQPKKPL